MKLVILIFGTPGVGKTTLANLLAKKLQLEHIELLEVVEKYGYFLGYDVFRDALIIDEYKVTNYLEEKTKSGSSFCYSGVEIFMDPSLVNLVLVLHCEGRVLRKRLKARGYSSEKIEENIAAENLGIVEGIVKDHYPPDKVFTLDTTDATPQETLKSALNIINEVISFKI